jgi:hypothetical protein
VGLFEQNTNIENVEAALNKITLEKINCTVDIVPVFIGELASTISLGVAGDEKLDIVTVGLTYAMSAAVADETILPLDELLAERGQGALAATAHVAEAQKVNGQTYGLTGYTYAANSGGFVYNKTMADKYGIKMFDGMTAEDLTAAAEILKQNGIYLTTMGNSSELAYKFLYGGDHFGSNAPYGSILDLRSANREKNTADYMSWIMSGNPEIFDDAEITGTPTADKSGLLQKYITVSIKKTYINPLGNLLESVGIASRESRTITAKAPLNTPTEFIRNVSYIMELVRESKK